MATYTHAYTISFLFPHDVDPTDLEPNLTPTYFTMKAPEIGNGLAVGRYQELHKMRNGANVVIDKGLDTDNFETWTFREIPDDERTRLITFLKYIKWGANKIAIKTHNDEWKIFRVVSTTLDFQELLKDRHADGTTTLKWDFSLRVIDVTENPVDLYSGDGGTEEGEVDMSVLNAHLADYNHPHNPKSVVTLVDADTDYLVDTVRNQYEKINYICWIVHVSQGANSRLYELKLQLDSDNTGNSGLPATNATLETMELDSVGGENVNVTFSFGFGADQTANQTVVLNAQSTIPNTFIKARRFKL